ncbi:hypothetical protein K469DRAFT_800239 [Zopfia rhizophila CBS 207.26]|uniref:Transglycosylase SLT domain-containing protein n=1 Tax=Zopfia rhizophila CBS 207.26 TaxID=1314779 RepID=A0A6A6EMK2_9PEZI|nr:hypothetical protein K469DRAFT_800239 [Zopfia rhizophila CBS 207.26]
MHSLSYLLLLTPLTSALPANKVRSSYSDRALFLRPELAQKWYSDWNTTDTNASKPWNPSAVYSCSGPDVDDYPTKEEWLSFETLWEINEPEITKRNYGDEYNNYIKKSIQDISMASKVDARIILALVMQESAGGVNIPCTGWDGLTTDCGLMQIHGGAKYDAADPAGSIHEMISDAIYGVSRPSENHPSGTPGYIQYFNAAQGDLSWIQGDYWQGNPFAAAHMYNAGGISSRYLNTQEGGNKNSKVYANDIASRLLGWNGQRPGCEASMHAILLCSQSTSKLLFECSTPDGVLSARAARDNSGLLAVADNHPVMLYDTRGGKTGSTSSRAERNETPVLKGTRQGEPRMLLFSPSSRTLYFATTLSPSIQAYSIPTAELLSPLQAHPSSPNVLAIAKEGDVLLSASPNPPTIFIQDLRLRESVPAAFHPPNAPAAACAAFYDYDLPSQISHRICVLGFQDGTLALYRLTIPKLPPVLPTSSNLQTESLQLRQPTLLGALKKLHKADMGGIFAATFLPNYKCRIERETVILSSNGTEQDKVYEGVEALTAIGTQGGKALVFNILSLLVREIAVQIPVIGVEWVGDMSAPSALPNRRMLLPKMSVQDVDEFEPPSQATLDLIFAASAVDNEEDKEIEEHSGTVKRTKSSPISSGPTSPVPVGRTRDLFSAEPEHRTSAARPSVWTFHKPSEVSYGSPQPVKCSGKRPRKSFPRPRIVTETFKAPVTPSTASSSASPASPRSTTNPVNPVNLARPISEIIPGIKEVRKWSQTSIVPSTPPISSALDLDSDASESEDGNQAQEREQTEVLVTPPTSHRSHSSLGISSPYRSMAFDTTSSSQSIAYEPTSQLKPALKSKSSLPSEALSPKTPVRSVAFAVSSPGTIEPESESRRVSWLAPRSMFTSTVGQDDGPGLGMDYGIVTTDWSSRRKGREKDASTKVERGMILKDNEKLRSEMEALRREFLMLKEAMLASRE